MRFYFGTSVVLPNMRKILSRKGIFGDKFYFVEDQVIISVSLFNRPSFECI